MSKKDRDAERRTLSEDLDFADEVATKRIQDLIDQGRYVEAEAFAKKAKIYFGPEHFSGVVPGKASRVKGDDVVVSDYPPFIPLYTKATLIEFIGALRRRFVVAQRSGQDEIERLARATAPNQDGTTNENATQLIPFLVNTWNDLAEIMPHIPYEVEAIYIAENASTVGLEPGEYAAYLLNWYAGVDPGSEKRILTSLRQSSDDLSRLPSKSKEEKIGRWRGVPVLAYRSCSRCGAELPNVLPPKEEQYCFEPVRNKAGEVIAKKHVFGHAKPVWRPWKGEQSKRFVAPSLTGAKALDREKEMQNRDRKVAAILAKPTKAQKRRERKHKLEKGRGQ